MTSVPRIVSALSTGRASSGMLNTGLFVWRKLCPFNQFHQQCRTAMVAAQQQEEGAKAPGIVNKYAHASCCNSGSTRVSAGSSVSSTPPPVAYAIMYENWKQLDDRADELLEAVRNSAATEIWHKHGSFKQHLQGVWKILHCWGCSQKICRLGLFHSAYSNSFVAMGIYNPDEDRKKLRDLVGEEAEELIYLFCVIDRSLFEKLLMVDHKGVIPAEGIVMEHLRTGEHITLSQETLAIFALHTVADYVEQFMQWQDSMERGKAGSLWPGSGLPHIRLSQMSKLLKTAVSCGALAPTDIPNIFGRGTEVLPEEHERKALDWYARGTKLDQLFGNDLFGNDAFGAIESVLGNTDKVYDIARISANIRRRLHADNENMAFTEIANEVTKFTDSSSPNIFAQEDSITFACLQRAASLNPYVGEPQILMAQLCAQNHCWEEAIERANIGCGLMYDWGTQWDKRVSWEGWIAWGRCIVYQSERKEWPATGDGMESLGAVAESQRYRQALNEGANFHRY